MHACTYKYNIMLILMCTLIDCTSLPEGEGGRREEEASFDLLLFSPSYSIATLYSNFSNSE